MWAVAKLQLQLHDRRICLSWHVAFESLPTFLPLLYRRFVYWNLISVNHWCRRSRTADFIATCVVSCTWTLFLLRSWSRLLLLITGFISDCWAELGWFLFHRDVIGLYFALWFDRFRRPVDRTTVRHIWRIRDINVWMSGSLCRIYTRTISFFGWLVILKTKSRFQIVNKVVVKSSCVCCEDPYISVKSNSISLLPHSIGDYGRRIFGGQCCFVKFLSVSETMEKIHRWATVVWLCH